MYRTFKRSCKNWQRFSSARKYEDERNLTYEQARRRCELLNTELTKAQIRKGTLYEFEQQ